MKKPFLFILALILTLTLAACGNRVSSSISGGGVVSSGQNGASATPAPGQQTFTLAELAQYNGKDGALAYVAVDGVVYDVTNVPQWANGEHFAGATAGQDLTEAIKTQSPHGLSVLEDVPVVGTLVEES